MEVTRTTTNNILLKAVYTLGYFLCFLQSATVYLIGIDVSTYLAFIYMMEFLPDRGNKTHSKRCGASPVTHQNKTDKISKIVPTA